MRAYVKKYLNFFGIALSGEETVNCEKCKNPAHEIHHIHLKGMGGRKTFIWEGVTYEINDIINLIALCRD